MPQTDATAYEYQPEEPVTTSQFMKVVSEIAEDTELKEDIDLDTLKCASGACPI